MKRERVLKDSLSIKSILLLMIASVSDKMVFNEFESILKDASIISLNLAILLSRSDILELTAAKSDSFFDRIEAIFASNSYLILAACAS